MFKAGFDKWMCKDYKISRLELSEDWSIILKFLLLNGCLGSIACLRGMKWVNVFKGLPVLLD